MSLRLQIIPRSFTFIKPAITSRGTYKTRKSWFIYYSRENEPDRFGVGECAPLKDLSCDDIPDYEERLRNICKEIEEKDFIDYEALRPYPSIVFGLETAYKHFECQDFRFWDTSFSRGEEGLKINGLIWMGNYEEMIRRLENKLVRGFRCIKIKIGGIDFEKEISLLKFIRSYLPAENLELRLDANGAFTPEEAMKKLDRLAELDIHSIEQPIKAGQPKQMREIIKQSPIAIALDEELIGCNQLQDKTNLLEAIRPQYLVLKPSLHGGFRGCEEWINEAKKLDIEYWATSALESNIGLNAIAQWCATHNNPLPQGLGTGQIYTDNIEVPIKIKGDSLWYNI